MSRGSPLPRRILRRGFREAGDAAHRIATACRRVESAVSTPEMVAADDRGLIAAAMASWNALENPDEPYYTGRYLEWIEAELERYCCDRSGTFLDAGCGQGRLLLPLAELLAPHGGRIVGVDLLGEEVARARQEASERRLENVELVEADLLDFLRSRSAEAFEAIVFLEVAYLLRDLESVLAELRRVLRPGGLLLAGFTPPYYLALLGVARREWETAETVLARDSGELPGLGWQSWHSRAEAVAQLRAAGFEDVALAGIGACSGIEGDPLAAVVRPSALAPHELEALARVERAFGLSHPDIGRYLLAAAVRYPRRRG